MVVVVVVIVVVVVVVVVMVVRTGKCKLSAVILVTRAISSGE